MKKRAFTAALLTALLASALAATLLANPAKANFLMNPPDSPLITVLSPESEKTYSSNSVNLMFTVGHSATPLTSSIQYYLDGRLLGQLDDAPKSFSVALTELSDGSHYVEVKAHATYYAYDILHFVERYSDPVSIYFTVDTSVPHVSVLALQGRTFDGADVPFNFTVSKPVAWVGYSLDGAAAVAIADAVVTSTYGRDNYYVVLHGLAAGSHRLTVYAEDEAGRRGESEAVGFAVAGEAQHEAEPSGSFPATVVAGTAMAAVVCVGLVAYYAKVKRKRAKP